MRFPFPISLFVALALVSGAMAPALAAEPVFPPGSRIGLVPPKGFVPSTVFRGFQDNDNKAVIVTFELPPATFTTIEQSDSIETVRKQGLTVEKREDFPVANGKGILFTGTEEAPGMKARKWLLFFKLPDIAIAVNVLIPETAKDVYSEEVIRASLATLATRAAPIEEKLSLLPFRVEDLAGFRVFDVADNRTLLLIDGPPDSTDVAANANMMLGAAAMTPVPAEERANFARSTLSDLTAFKDMRVTFAEPVRLGGQQGFELRVNAIHAATGTEVSIVQWIRFGTGGVVRIVGVAPKDKWADTFPRFRAVRDSLAVR